MKKGKAHSFLIEDAEAYGMKEAVLLANIRHWLDKNKANKSNIYDGRVWTYNSYKAFAELFSYMSVKQIRTALNKLIEAGILITGNYNKAGYDRTLWYTIDEAEYVLNGDDQEDNSKSPDGHSHLPKRAEPFAQEGSPIPDIKPYSKPDINTHTTREREACDIWRDSDDEIDRKIAGYSDKWKTAFFVDAWNQIYKDHMKMPLKPNDKKHKQVMKKLADYEPSQIISALKNRAKDDWLKEQGIMGVWNKFWEFGDKVEEYLNRQYSKKPEKTNKPDYGYNMPWDMY